MSCVPKTTQSLLFALTLFLMGSLFSIELRAQDDCYRDTNDRIPCSEYEEEWKESDIKIPTAAKDSDFKLLAVTEADARYQYYLAGNSINLGSDGVMRYTVAVVSSNGVRNVFYEGLRCETDEVKTYAYGSKRGTFRRAVKSPWRPVSNKGVRAYQDFLAKVIVCGPQGYKWEAKKARRALNRQFTAGGFRKGRNCRSCDNDDLIRND